MAELWRYRTLVKNLVLRDLKLKYRDSVIGVAWSLLNPLLLLAVYTLAFRYVLRMPVQDYPFFLLTGLLPWNFFAAAALGSTGAIVDNGPLLRKTYFPREALPIARVLFAFAQLLLALAVFLPVFLLFSGVALRPSAALYIVILVLHLAFAIGLALLLSALAARWRDIAHLVEVGLVLAFWATPIIYPASLAPPPLLTVFELSPLAAFAIAYQDSLFWGRPPALSVIAVIVTSAVAALGLGALVFRRGSSAFAEQV